MQTNLQIVEENNYFQGLQIFKFITSVTNTLNRYDIAPAESTFPFSITVIIQTVTIYFFLCLSFFLSFFFSFFLFISFFVSLTSSPTHCRCRKLLLHLITFSRTPLNKGSARRRNLYLTTHNTHKRKTSPTPAGFKPAIPASDRMQTHALDLAATGIGRHNSP